MHIIVNGSEREIARASNVSELIAELGHPDRGVAVAIDDVVVPKGRWTTTSLVAGQRVEVLTAVQGG